MYMITNDKRCSSTDPTPILYVIFVVVPLYRLASLNIPTIVRLCQQPDQRQRIKDLSRYLFFICIRLENYLALKRLVVSLLNFLFHSIHSVVPVD